eukprot:COSAG05_NODE_3538_length_2004_cov_1.701312_1_plen_177_part_01
MGHLRPVCDLLADFFFFFHADGCGEGHIILGPNGSWAQPPYYASKMIYNSYLPRAIKVTATAIAPPVDAPGNSGRRNLTAFGATDKAGQVVSLRFVNDNNVSVAITLVFAGGWSTNNASASAAGKVAVSLPYVQNQPVSTIIASISCTCTMKRTVIYCTISAGPQWILQADLLRLRA